MGLISSLITDASRHVGKPRLYTARRFRRRERLRTDYCLLASSLLKRIPFNSVLDVGCANGFLLQQFKTAGKAVWGIELSPDVREVLASELLPYVDIGDFSTGHGRWDLVCCVEVAEHLKPCRSVELVDKLVGMAIRYIYFTSAPPGQLGYGHINCRPHAEWLRWFEERGWEPTAPLTRELRQDLEGLRQAKWLRQNSFILRTVIR